jgi:hypothetical protein
MGRYALFSPGIRSTPTYVQQTLTGFAYHTRCVSPVCHYFSFSCLVVSTTIPHTRIMYFVTGSTTECKYQLMTFGIPAKELPLTDSGKSKAKSLSTTWIQLRQAIESTNECYTQHTRTRWRQEQQEQSSTKCSIAYDGDSIATSTNEGNSTHHDVVAYHRSFGVSGDIVDVATIVPGRPPSKKTLVECPRNQDVLFYNGGAKWTYPGNAAFREVLESRRVAYVALAKKDYKEKRAIIREIVSSVVQGMGGQFLTWDKAHRCWEVLEPDSDLLRERVSASLRDHYKRVKVNREKQHPQPHMLLQQEIINNATIPSDIPEMKKSNSKRKWSNEDDDSEYYDNRRGFFAACGCNRGTASGL